MAKGSGGTPATTALQSAGIDFVVHEYSLAEGVLPGRGGETTYGEAVAAYLQVEPERVYKTLVAASDGHLVVGVVPVVTTLDLKALATAVGHKKAELANVAVAERTTGYVIGGISPFGQRKQLTTVVDETVELFDTVFVSAGKRGLQLEVAPADLISATAAIVWPLARQ